MRRIILFLLCFTFTAVGIGQIRQSGLRGSSSTSSTSGLTKAADSDTGVAVTGDLAVSGELNVGGNVTAGGTLTVTTTTSPKLQADSVVANNGFRTNGGIRSKTLSQFGATTTPMVIEADGDVGIGTTAPYTDLSVVNGGGIQSGIHVVNSTINKNRSTWAQAADSASALLQVLATGQSMLRLRAADGDSMSMYTDGARGYITSQTAIRLSATAVQINAPSIQGITSNVTTLGGSTLKFSDLWLAEHAYIGGKSLTPELTIGTHNTMTEQLDSCMVLTNVSGEPVIDLNSAAGVQGLYAVGDKVGIGTTTPLYSTSIVNGGGVATGLHVVNSTINKNRTSAAQAADSASALLQVLAVGDAWLRLKAKDADSLSVWDDGTNAYIKSKNDLTLANGTALNITSGMALKVGTVQWDVAASDSINGAAIAARTIPNVALPSAITLGASNFAISAVDTVFTAGYVPRWVKFTSGGKSWYSPVYADTTGKW